AGAAVGAIGGGAVVAGFARGHDAIAARRRSAVGIATVAVDVVAGAAGALCRSVAGEPGVHACGADTAVIAGLARVDDVIAAPRQGAVLVTAISADSVAVVGLLGAVGEAVAAQDPAEGGDGAVERSRGVDMQRVGTDRDGTGTEEPID